MTAEELALLAEQEGLGACNEQAPLRSIDYTRPLGEYATPDQIATFLSIREQAQHVYTESLNKNGIAVQESMSKYLASKGYINSGALKEAQKSPLHLFYEVESGWREKLEAYEKTKNHYVLGSFIHQALLEPTKFGRAIVEPAYKLNTKDGVQSMVAFWEDKIASIGTIDREGLLVSYKDAIESMKGCIESSGLGLDKIDGLRTYCALLKSSSGFTAITESDKLIIDIIHSNYKRYGDGLFYDLLKRSKREISLYYDDPIYGIKQRIRPDALQFSENIGADTIISVKSTRAESIGHFTYQSAKLNYELTEGMYCEVASAVTERDFNCVITIMVQTVAPFGVAALVWDGEDIEIGKYKYRQALQTTAECFESGKYPGYDAYAESGNRGLIAMKQPEWNTKELHPVDIND